jgi:hypothetical protein
MQQEIEERNSSRIIPTHLNKPDRVLGPFTRQGLLVFIIACGISVELYMYLAILTPWGAYGGALQIGLAALPLLLALLLTQKTWQGRTLGTWCFLSLLYWHRPKLCLWLSVQLRDRYMPPHPATWEEQRPGDEDDEEPEE